MSAAIDLEPLVHLLRKTAEGLEKGDNPLLLMVDLGCLTMHLLKMALEETECQSTDNPSQTT